MKILITGGTGFIGSNAAQRFIDKGHEVILLDNLSRRGSNINLEWLRSRYHGGFTFFEGDVRDESLLNRVFFKAGHFDAVLHLAAQVAVTTSVLDPLEDFTTNALGTLNILETVRRYNGATPPLVIYASTNKVYGKMDELGICERKRRYEYSELKSGVSEDQKLDFHSPYGCSKGAADQYVIDYARIYGIPTVSFRQSCIYGLRQFGVEDQGWVAWFTIAAALNKPITIYGNGKQVRDVLFVEDLLDAYEAAMAHPEKAIGQAFNIGGGPKNQLSLLELIRFLERFLGEEIVLSYADWRPGDQRVFVCNINKAEEVLSWRPRTSLAEGIRKLYDWVIENRHLFAEVRNVR